ncbi:MAG: BglG family transcription antiterminator [Eubacteriales bacterium]|nr:BglG family transcription antiterminator [Eubacteriales bacterium]
MKSLFHDNRIANILQFLRKTPEVTVSALASRLGVSERTVRNDIKQINQELQDCAVIDGVQGKYSLRIFQAERFREIFSEMIQADEFLNSSRNRMDYMFGRLMRSDEPLLTDELAYEMNVGRTTLMSDLKKLREEIEDYQLKIIGKTSKGLMLHGTETNIRKYVLNGVYASVYQEYPLDQEIIEEIQKTFSLHSFEKSVRDSFEQFTTLMLDRFLTGHYIGLLPQRYYNLTARAEFAVIDQLVDRFSQILHIRIPIEEKLFVFLPIAGMRTPADIQDMRSIELDDTVRPLMRKILRRVKMEMDITIQSGEFTEEFLYHLMFMMNRLRFHVPLKNPMLEDLREKYPLAYKMAGIAAQVVQEEYQLIVTEDERGYLASYFGVFLTETDLKQEKPFQVAVVCGTGRVTARLVAVQLKKILDSSAQIQLFADEKVNQELLDEFDIVLTTVDLPCSCDRPIIRIHEIFNERELLHKIEKARYWDQIKVPVLDNNWFVMSALLDESRFFVLKEPDNYQSAIDYMVNSLIASGQVDDRFAERLREREQKGTMVFDHSVAIPHSIQYASDKLMLSIGVFPQAVQYGDHDIRVIFLIGLPSQVEADDNLLIRVYDEIISITKDEELLHKIASADSFSALLRVLYRHIGE